MDTPFGYVTCKRTRGNLRRIDSLCRIFQIGHISAFLTALMETMVMFRSRSLGKLTLTHFVFSPRFSVKRAMHAYRIKPSSFVREIGSLVPIGGEYIALKLRLLI